MSLNLEFVSQRLRHLRVVRLGAAVLMLLVAALLMPSTFAASHPSGSKAKTGQTAKKAAPPSSKSAKAASAKKKIAATSVRTKKSAKSSASKTKNAPKTTASKHKAVASKTGRKPAQAKAKLSRAKKTAVAAAALSYGQKAGLHRAADPLSLKSNVAFVMDQDSKEVLLSKNERAVLPIASITKLMTALIVAEAHLPLDELITITAEDVDRVKGSSSRLAVGTKLTRHQLLHLALMSSENRAAHALGRTYPGGIGVFVHEMNMRARLLGMTNTRFTEPTGLSSRNQSSARDLATLVNVAHANELVRELSISPSLSVQVGSRTLQFNNTNRLVKSDRWDIGLQKTGYISEAGRCLVMQADVGQRKLIMVFLDSAGKYSRLGDAERVRHWVQNQPSTPRMSASARGY